MPATVVLSQACPGANSEDMAAKDAAMAPGNREFEIDLRPTVLELIGRVEAGEEVGRLAAAFHNTIAAALADGAKWVAEWSGVRTVAASGGVFCNRYLTTRLADLLSADGSLELLTHRQVPPNDGGLALGQAAVAAARAAQLAGVESSFLTQMR
jgi:hydrogenase maturation protein HypF